MSTTIHQAKAQLSALIDSAEGSFAAYDVELAG
jgi:hypothetical protein